VVVQHRIASQLPGANVKRAFSFSGDTIILLMSACDWLIINQEQKTKNIFGSGKKIE
jgi:hypothetical protein